jgi:hypothetical protein
MTLISGEPEQGADRGAQVSQGTLHRNRKAICKQPPFPVL